MMAKKIQSNICGMSKLPFSGVGRCKAAGRRRFRSARGVVTTPSRRGTGVSAPTRSRVAGRGRA